MTTIKDAPPGTNSDAKSQSTSTSRSTTPNDLPDSTDVLIVGAGPVGLLIAYQLSKFGCHNYVIIDKEDKTNAPVFGRACTIWPRTEELWDQLGLMDEMFSAGGVISSTGYNFRDGQAVPGALSFAHRMDQIGDTAFKFCFNLRQRKIEKVLEAKLWKEFGRKVVSGLALEGMVDESLSVNGQGEGEDMGVEVRVREVASDTVRTVRAKYLIGTDGGKSTVRKLAGIPFIGSKSGAKWIRMDALIDTDIPNPRCLNSVQSPTHGLILFCPVDDNLTRIGYVFSEHLQKKWKLGEETVTGPAVENGGLGGLKLEAVIEEAQEAVKPFRLDFKRVDWYTIYGIGQCIAGEFVKGRTILAGDACHAHSSGSAQGLNTGSHDAINLAWKLSLALKGLSSPKLMLGSYAEERKQLVQKVIDNDSIIATLISGYYPEKYKHRTGESTRDLLTEWCENAENKNFTLGLSVAYAHENLLDVPTISRTVSAILPGERGPDGPLNKIGTGESVRLHSTMPLCGRFYVAVFTGAPHQPRAQAGLRAFRASLDGLSAFTKAVPRVEELVEYVTIVAGADIGTAEILQGCAPFGKTYFDPLRRTHEAYGIDTMTGGVVVFRPDGHVGTVMPLGEETNGLLKGYFERFCKVD